MSLESLASSSLNLTQLMGFTIENTGLMRGVTAATGIGQMLLGFFGGSDGTASVVIATGEKIMEAIKVLEQQIELDIKLAFEEQYLSSLGAAQDQLKKAIDRYLTMEGPESLDAATEKTLDADYANWRLSIVEPVVVSPESSVVKAINWAASNEGSNYSTLSMYMLGAALYLDYCKLGIGLEYHEMNQNWVADNPPDKPNPDPPPDQENLKQGLYYGYLVDGLDKHMAFLEPKITAINDAISVRHSDVFDPADDLLLLTAAARGKAFDAANAKYRIEFISEQAAEDLNGSFQNLSKAKDEWAGDLF